MTTDVAYLDASAAVKLITPERQTVALARALAGVASWVSSELLEIELRCTAYRLGRAEHLERADALLHKCDLLAFDAQVRNRAGRPFKPAQRALDAIHLASAIQLDVELAFVSYDERQLKAATSAGLRCVSPE